MSEVRFLRVNERVLVNVSAIRFVTLYDAEGAVVVEGGGEMRVYGEHVAAAGDGAPRWYGVAGDEESDP